MCGIVGYIGPKDTLPILIEGLKRLEYRGYDSAGIALSSNGKILVRKKAGKVADLVADLKKSNGLPQAHLGMGHTRWATHGEPNDINAHPHVDCKGHVFKSETDTEILAHLIEEIYKTKKDLFAAVRLALREVRGTYGLVVLSKHEPDKLIAARMGSPLILGLGEGESFVAADAAAIISHTRQVVYLNDGEVAEITAHGFETKTIYDVSIDKAIEEITFDLSQIERGGYEHFMMKEIHEQPETIRNAMRGRLLVEEGNVRLGGLDHVRDKLLDARRFIIIGCGTSWHAGLVGEYMLEHIAKVPTEVEY
ncbi:MAG: glmS, partial [Bacteroidetes bacterium]|nr:glmS [Bacteroidota bacterium]